MHSKKLWSGRFTKQTHPAVEQYTASISFDCALAREDILGSLAHAEMLQISGILSQEELHHIQQGLKKIAQAIKEGSIQFRAEDEDIHMNIERLLTEAIGDAAKKLHTARSRNDQVALDIHLYLRKKILNIAELLVVFQRTLLESAQAHRQILMPGYTHLQRAQPIYLAQHWLAYVAMLQRDMSRLQQNFKHTNYCPLGAAALTGTTFAVDRYYVFQALGFEANYLNSLDAVSDRDFVIEFIATSSVIMMHLSRLSEELILWSSQEFNFIQFDDGFSTGSSIMPQKKNPDVVELGRGKTGRVYGALLSVLTLMKALPLAYNKDLQEDKEPLFDVIKTVESTLSVYIPALSSLKINDNMMRAAVDNGYLNATSLAEYLVKQGLAFRLAHEIVGKMVAACVHRNCKLEELSLAEMQTFYPQFTEEVYQILSPEYIASLCNQDQLQHQSMLDKQLEQFEAILVKSEQWLLDETKKIEQVYARYGV